MDDLRFPLFVKDRDGYMYLIKNKNQINADLEAIDVELDEYVCWDIKGNLINLNVENDFIFAKYTGGSDLPGLKISLVLFASRHLELDIRNTDIADLPLESLFSKKSIPSKKMK